MPNYANITIIGHLGRDPETKQLGDNSVTNFSIAVTEKRKGKDPLTTWYDIAAWNKTGEFAQNYLKKGSAVMVVGTPALETYTAKDGTPKSKISVRADKIVGVGARTDADAEAPETPTADLIKPNPNLAEAKAKLKAMQAAADAGNDGVPF